MSKKVSERKVKAAVRRTQSAVEKVGRAAKRLAAAAGKRPRGGASFPCQCHEEAVTRVVDTRRKDDGVLRRRRCVKCKKLFHTIEKGTRV